MGDAAATLVLLPGMDGTGELFEPFVAALAGAFPTQIVSYPADDRLGYRELEKYVQDRLPAGPFVLLGESFSGPLAVALAAKHPAGLRGVILCCSFVRNPRPALGLFRGLLNFLPLAAAPRFARDALLCGLSAPRELRQRLDAALSRVPPSVLRARLCAILAIEVARELEEIAVPVLSLQATRDRLVPRAASRELARLRPSLQTASIPGPHLLLQANPAESAAVVRRFLASLE